MALLLAFLISAWTLIWYENIVPSLKLKSCPNVSAGALQTLTPLIKLVIAFSILYGSELMSRKETSVYLKITLVILSAWPRRGIIDCRRMHQQPRVLPAQRAGTATCLSDDVPAKAAAGDDGSSFCIYQCNVFMVVAWSWAACPGTVGKRRA